MQNMSATESEISRRNVGSDNIVKLSSRWLAHLNLGRDGSNMTVLVGNRPPPVQATKKSI